MKIEILLATYNSAKYLKEQLDSILNQDFDDWQLTIRDDCSKDNTLEIINGYMDRFPNKIKLLATDKNLGAKKNFNQLLISSQADYIMFADHDDVWNRDKISLTFERMLEIEKEHSSNIPILVFTDKSVVDEDLNILYVSHVRAENYKFAEFTLNSLLVQNVASGCSMMVNRALIKLCGVIPDEARMHDEWLMLVACTFGEISYVDTPTMLYRQHSSNELGAVSYGWRYVFRLVMKGRANIRKRFMSNVQQGAKFLRHYGDKIPETKREVFDEFVKLETSGWCESRYIMIKNNFLKTGLLRKIGQLLQ